MNKVRMIHTGGEWKEFINIDHISTVMANGDHGSQVLLINGHTRYINVNCDALIAMMNER